MEYKKGDFVPNDEVDEISWVSASKADDVLTYRHDAKLLAHL
jgi:hypothetical protein